MSLIPKIGIGTSLRKNKFHVPAITHGTSEIGYVVPSYSRNLINNASVNLSTRTVVRLSPLFVPTMGDLSVRHYHCFVPFNKMWTPFDAFMDKKPFAFSGGFSAVPTDVPHFCVGVLLRHLMQFNVGLFESDSLGTLRSDLVAQMYYRENSDNDWNQLQVNDFRDFFGYAPGSAQTLNDDFAAIWNTNNLAIQEGSNYRYGGVPSLLYVYGDTPRTPLATLVGDLGQDGLVYKCPLAVDCTSDRYEKAQIRAYEDNLSIPTIDACDFTVRVVVNGREYLICYNFNGSWKRIRSIFLGLGYAFNPYDTEYVTPFKLMAFYRCYWSKFGVNRNYNFQDTKCAILTREISRLSGGTIDGVNDFNTTLQQFVKDELTKCTYTTPSDYFNSSVTNTQQSLLDSGNSVQIGSLHGAIINASSESQSAYQVGAVARAGASQYQNSPANPVAGGYGQGQENLTTALGLQMAMKLMRWINRRTVVGSAIYDGLRSLYGNIDINDESSEGVVRIGEDTTDVQIGAIFNQSDFINDSGAPLGSFAGVGTGRSGKQNRYKFTAPSFGCVITLTAVVPQMGYFQGMLRENSDGVKDNYEMFDPTFDAVGWQSVRYNELAADRMFDLQSNNYSYIGTALGIFGAQPRYTHMKVGFNRCIGDISLPHMQDSMLPYTLDRFFPQRKPLPVNVPQSFRSATQGETNRIFQVVSPTDDHVIWQIYFDVDMFAPMKSISDSYDTHTSDDNGEMQVSHE